MERDWWKKAVAYQIYPRSFCDSNGDGVGDLPGIMAKLDYLQQLGVDVLWICPIYRSPMDDNGYDISDYREVDPVFGTNADLEKLIGEAGRRGMKILMDLVINHCSDEHPWFRKALADPDCEEASYFIFKRPSGGKRPNNWRSIFGGSAWEPVGDGRYYLHLFSKKQPDFNWENPRLRQKLYEMVNWWLDKGIAGFRVDAITHIKKDQRYRDLPPDGPDGLAGIGEVARNHPGIGEFLRELRDSTYGPRGAVTVAEAPGVPYDQLEDFIGPDGYFSMIFDFNYTDLDVDKSGCWYVPHTWTAAEFRDKLFASQKAVQEAGWGAVFLENHDQPRSLSKYIPPENQNRDSAAMLGTLFFLLRGTPFIYQGQELGLPNSWFGSVEDFSDLSTVDQYHRALEAGCTREEALKAANRRSRDQSRMPMPWNSAPQAGFTSGRPWLQIPDHYQTLNVETEQADVDSVWRYYQRLVKLRKESSYSRVLTEGDFVPCVLEPDTVIAYIRRLEEQEVLVMCNFGPDPAEVELPWETGEILLCTREPQLDGKRCRLDGYQAVVASRSRR